MNVKELIEQLKKLPQDSEVGIYIQLGDEIDNHYYSKIESIEYVYLPPEDDDKETEMYSVHICSRTDMLIRKN